MHSWGGHAAPRYLGHPAPPPSLPLPPQVAIVGYTNAGKSSLLAALSKDSEGVGVEDRLFQTLDPTLR